MIHLSLIQRYFLESISQGAQTIDQVLDSTAIKKEIGIKVLNSLVEKELIFIHMNKIELNINNIKKINTDQNKKHKSYEVKRLIKEAVTSHDLLKLKKVTISQEQSKLISKKFSEIEAILSYCQNKKGSIKDQKVFFWGESAYGQLIQNYLT